MNDGILCSFYGKDDDCCDVGCDYISSSDVPTIIRYCSADYRSCHRYQELAHRFSISPRVKAQVAVEALPRQSRPSIQFKDPLVKPFQVKWSLPSLWHQVSTRSMLEPVPLARQRRIARTCESQAARQVSTVAGSGPVQGPVPMGLLGFGVATVLLSLQMAGFFPLVTVLMTMGVFYAGLVQVISGAMEWRKNNTFGGTAFIAYGLFCLALVAVAVMTHIGMAPAPSGAATAACLGLLSLVSATLFLGALRFEKAWRRLLAMLTISFVLLTLGNATDLASLKLAAGCGGIATGTLVTCAGLVLFFKAIYGRRGFVPVHA
jgi:hypothetical protein